MCNPFVRALLGLSVGLVLISGTALAKAGEEQSPKPASKSATAKKSVLSSKDAAARRTRIKKIGSAATKETPKVSLHRKSSNAEASTTNHPAEAQIASNSDGSSVAERRARIHSMRVPE